jgi:hypothetical protein
LPSSPAVGNPSGEKKPKQGFFAWMRAQWKRFVQWVTRLFTSEPQTLPAGEGNTHRHPSRPSTGDGGASFSLGRRSAHQGHLRGASAVDRPSDPTSVADRDESRNRHSRLIPG